MRALVTGMAGFVGGHLATLLRERGFEVCGIVRMPATGGTRADCIERKVGDVCDREFVVRAVRQFRPSHVFHMAWAFTNSGNANCRATEENSEAAAVLFEGVRQAGVEPWILLASSSAVYGSPKVLPIDEDAALEPTTAYGVSKVSAEAAADAFHRKYGMNIIVTRTFNLIGPGVPERLLPGSLAAQIAAAENGGPRMIKVGRLDSSRDYLDVRDAVRAYVGLAMRPDVKDRAFNVCGGVSRTGRELADALTAAATVPLELVEDSTRMQVGDVDCQRGSAARLAQATGWSPEISFSTSVREMLQKARFAAQLRTQPGGRGATD